SQDGVEMRRQKEMAGWRYMVIDDLRSLPDESTPFASRGLRSSLRVPITAGGRLLGSIDVMSSKVGQYGPLDVEVLLRISDQVGLPLSHHRLAEESRRAAQLESRAANLELLDQSLASVTETGGLDAVFDRVSSMARTVLPHDALALPVLLPDGLHARRYASS